ncbi:cation/multidrug efflux pump [Desulfitobacterium dichloroeliminans LMG P-21439]|uniref:Cation/multidrug efflux pump n=1 Tax=Desulfitobacterium dichloroeliminans (strain LMG P-21439 / DCA1) TaxID=871963 RepID=L0FDD0_DESDL|nr:efflux RND transporter permease subunit [Desulfitobacterium dichloroeliminans]AGA70651.1 cation/multidrug efflux pump [Desulfitobacterium dichloroeliminans LMG P-21439]
MKKNISYYAIKNSRFTIFLIILSVIAAGYSYYFLPRQESPDISAPKAIVTTVYPGASPEDVEELITKKIEDVVVEVEGYDFLSSTSKNGISMVAVFLENGVDADAAWDDMEEKLANLQAELPEQSLPMNVNTDFAETAGMLISISSDNKSYKELSDYADQLKDELSKIDGVQKFEIDGALSENIEIKVDIEKLNQYKISLEDISNMIKAENIQMPSGKVDNNELAIVVQTNAAYTTLDEIKNTVLITSPQNLSQVKIADIAEVSYQVDDSLPRFKLNGQKTVLLSGYFEGSVNAVLTGKNVEQKVNEFSKALPSEIAFNQVTFQPHDIERSINDFIINLIEAVILVIAVVFIGMGSRKAIIVSTTIPLSLALTFSAMYVLGIKLEQMSISALIISLGMLVDNAIVASDSIQYYIDQGKGQLEAVIEGVRAVSYAMLTSTLTIVFAFTPLLLMDSAVGQYVFGIPSVVIIALLSSYVCALVTTPFMAYFFFKKTDSKKIANTSKTRHFFSMLLEKALQRKIATVLIIFLAFGFSLLLVRQLEVSLFPKADKNILNLYVTSENASDINELDRLSSSVRELLMEQPEVVSIVEAIGDGLPKFYMTVSPASKSDDSGQTLVTFDLEKGKRFTTKGEFLDFIQAELNNNVVGGTVTAHLLDAGSSSAHPISVRVSARDMERLEQVIGLIEAEMEEIEGTINIGDTFVAQEYQFYVNVNENLAGSYGLTKYDVQKEITNALKGNATSILRRNSNEYPIRVMSNIETKEQLESLMIKSTKTGAKVPLKTIAAIETRAEYPTLTRYNRERSVEVYSDLLTGYEAKDIETQLMTRITALNLEDITVDFDSGQMALIKDSFSQLGVLGIFSLFLILTVLVLQFNSFKQAAIILSTIPVSFTGGILGLFLTGQNLSFTAFLGIVSLMGIVVGNGIILMDYINVELEAGRELQEACKAAAARRFSPIMNSSVTTVIGLIPLAISGGETFRPMAIAIISGLSLSTLLSLVVVPMLASIGNKKSNSVDPSANLTV